MYWTVASISLHFHLIAPLLSFPPLSEIGSVNGFYLMFFLLSHSPICSPICQCHLSLWLSEFSFTQQTLLFLQLMMMLIMVMDGINGNSFIEPPFLRRQYVLKCSVAHPYVRPQTVIVAWFFYMIFTQLKLLPNVEWLELFIIKQSPECVFFSV